MVKGMNMLVLMVFLGAAIQSCSAQTTYVVGDGVGWNVLVNTTQAYELWAANKTFMVGDILVFNFVNGTQNVAEVTKSAFDSCNTTSTISVYTNPPVRITLANPGEHFYTSTYPSRCSLGQKLAINVIAASAPAPAPTTTPTPPAPSAPAPTTTPTRSPVTYIVGDGVGWNVLVNTTQAYELWAANKTFMVGDILVFNFVNGTQNVAEVTKSAFDSCNTTSTISVYTDPPVRITLATPGEHFYTSTYPSRCSLGQKLAINVIAASAPTPAPTTTPTPPAPSTPAPTTTPTRSPVTYIVGDGVGWNVLVNTTQAYELWAANKTFMVGDILVFNFVNGTQNVAEVTKSAFDSCNTTSTISVYTDPPVRITLATPGEHFYTSTYPSRCSLGQKLAINVIAASAPTPAPTTTPTPPAPSAPTSTPTPTRSPMTYTVGDGVGWNVLVNTTRAYELWAASKTFMVGDILVFNFVNGTQNVAEVTKSAFDSCNTTSTISVYTVSPVRITLATTGEHFYTSTYPNRCSLGQKLAINVIGGSTTTPSPSPATPPSSTATSPSTSTSPPPPTAAPSPENSAASLGITGLFSGMLSIAVVLLY